MSSVFRRSVYMGVLGFLVIASVLALFAGFMCSVVRMLLVGTSLLVVFTFFLLVYRSIRNKHLAAMVFLILLLVPATVLSFKFFTGTAQFDRAGLRSLYVNRLESYMGVRYTWGGETKVGIDCSGLARTALIEAMIIQGWRKGNARIMWPIAWRLWLHDAGASAMMQEAYGYTCVIGKAGVLSSPETIRMNLGFTLQPGDLGVAGSGCHVMIYTGNGRWIEANPDDGRVVENMADSSKRAYFNLRIVILRWWML